jgi:hypothetical protein
MAGYKLFFVSAQGKFWIYSTVHTDNHIMDVTLDDLYANPSQKGVLGRLRCLLRNRRFASRGKTSSRSGQGNCRARQAGSIHVSSFLNSNADEPTHSAITNPNGTHEMNGGTNGSPCADDRVTLRKGA